MKPVNDGAAFGRKGNHRPIAMMRRLPVKGPGDIKFNRVRRRLWGVGHVIRIALNTDQCQRGEKCVIETACPLKIIGSHHHIADHLPPPFCLVPMSSPAIYRWLVS